MIDLRELLLGIIGYKTTTFGIHVGRTTRVIIVFIFFSNSFGDVTPTPCRHPGVGLPFIWFGLYRYYHYRCVDMYIRGVIIVWVRARYFIRIVRDAQEKSGKNNARTHNKSGKNFKLGLECMACVRMCVRKYTYKSFGSERKSWECPSYGYSSRFSSTSRRQTDRRKWYVRNTLYFSTLLLCLLVQGDRFSVSRFSGQRANTIKTFFTGREPIPSTASNRSHVSQVIPAEWGGSKDTARIYQNGIVPRLETPSVHDPQCTIRIRAQYVITRNLCAVRYSHSRNFLKPARVSKKPRSGKVYLHDKRDLRNPRADVIPSMLLAYRTIPINFRSNVPAAASGFYNGRTMPFSPRTPKR